MSEITMIEPIVKVARKDLATFLRKHGDLWWMETPYDGDPSMLPPFTTDQLITRLIYFDPNIDYVFVIDEHQFAGDSISYEEREKAPFVEADDLDRYAGPAIPGEEMLCVAASDDQAGDGDYLYIAPYVPEALEPDDAEMMGGPRLVGMSIENFKGVRERINISLKPITMLFGANSAGKSSIVHSLHYAREILDRRNFNADHTLGGDDAIDLGGFESFVHGHDRRSQIHLGYDLDLTNTTLPTFKDPIPRGVPIDDADSLYGIVSNARVEISIGWSELFEDACATRYAVHINNAPLAEIEFRPGSPDIALSLNTDHEVFVRARENTTIWTWHPNDPDQWDETDSAINALLQWVLHGKGMSGGQGKSPYTFDLALVGQKDALPNLNSQLSFDADWDWAERMPEFRNSGLVEMVEYLSDAISDLVIGPAIILRDLISQTRYIGPLRQVPTRNFEKPRFQESQKWADGTAAWNLLLSDNKALVSSVQSWLADADKLNIGYRVEPKRFKELDQGRLELIESMISMLDFDGDFDALKLSISEELAAPPWSARLALFSLANDVEVEPQDVGVGISQLVPVVVAVLDNHDGITAIEQPELHLHPAVQVGIGDLLVAGTQSQNRVLLIETHSEHIILRLLRRIRETTECELPPGHPGLDPSTLSVVYIESEAGRIAVTPLRVDKTGEFRDRWPKGFFDERAGELF